MENNQKDWEKGYLMTVVRVNFSYTVINNNLLYVKNLILLCYNSEFRSVFLFAS